ncbi:hypothetical protein [Paenibacillus sp. 1P07SE]|uniref:hypothetical protein n=1 Tax=Paenibacillus sp. 1P07SE TaxID=3132209 RepID=UPI0039A68B58
MIPSEPYLEVWLHGLLLLLWCAAGCYAASLAKSSTHALLKQRARMLIWLMLPILLLTGGLVTMMVLPHLQPAQTGLHEGLLMQAPLLLLSTAAVIAFSLPRLWTIVRYIGSARRVPSPEQRGMTADPFFVTPVYVAACSAACSLYYSLAPPLALSLSWRQLLLPVLALGLLLCIAALAQLRVHRRISNPVMAGSLAREG